MADFGGGAVPRASFPKNGSDYDSQRKKGSRPDYNPALKTCKIVGSPAAPFKGEDFVNPAGNEQRDAR